MNQSFFIRQSKKASKVHYKPLFTLGHTVCHLLLSLTIIVICHLMFRVCDVLQFFGGDGYSSRLYNFFLNIFFSCNKFPSFCIFFVNFVSLLIQFSSLYLYLSIFSISLINYLSIYDCLPRIVIRKPNYKSAELDLILFLDTR